MKERDTAKLVLLSTTREYWGLVGSSQDFTDLEGPHVSEIALYEIATSGQETM